MEDSWVGNKAQRKKNKTKEQQKKCVKNKALTYCAATNLPLEKRMFFEVWNLGLLKS